MEKNEQEFTSVVEKYKSTVYSVCYMFSKDREELDDLFQALKTWAVMYISCLWPVWTRNSIWHWLVR